MNGSLLKLRLPLVHLLLILGISLLQVGRDLGELSGGLLGGARSWSWGAAIYPQRFPCTAGLDHQQPVNSLTTSLLFNNLIITD